MKKIIIGNRDRNKKYDFRETCFGIVIKDGEIFCTQKNEEISLIGGGIEEGETHIDCLKREFLEEAGCYIEGYKEFCTIDCFWVTREQKDMESLANIYIVRISEKIINPIEEGNKLVKIRMENILEKLQLPYQRRAIEEYIKINYRFKYKRSKKCVKN